MADDKKEAKKAVEAMERCKIYSLGDEFFDREAEPCNYALPWAPPEQKIFELHFFWQLWSHLAKAAMRKDVPLVSLRNMSHMLNDAYRIPNPLDVNFFGEVSKPLAVNRVEGFRDVSFQACPRSFARSSRQEILLLARSAAFPHYGGTPVHQTQPVGASLVCYSAPDLLHALACEPYAMSDCNLNWVYGLPCPIVPPIWYMDQ